MVDALYSEAGIDNQKRVGRIFEKLLEKLTAKIKGIFGGYIGIGFEKTPGKRNRLGGAVRSNRRHERRRSATLQRMTQPLCAHECILRKPGDPITHW